MSPELYQELVEIFEAALPFLVGGGATVAIQFIKDKIGSADWLKAIAEWFKASTGAVITIVVSVLMAIMYVSVEGYFDPGAWDVSNLSEVFLALITAASTYYFKLVKPKERDKADEIR